MVHLSVVYIDLESLFLGDRRIPPTHLHSSLYPTKFEEDFPLIMYLKPSLMYASIKLLLAKPVVVEEITIPIAMPIVSPFVCLKKFMMTIPF